ncbi:NACHT domain-containing protein [Streptomyces sp. CBMA156]|uniref:NACHT domain-containing protein n=1 Tax=Streptomyces sp. CBMA156 TaxID=1930280 RepID=UPI00166218F4|nr:NACHT domain-containing protein [Streptomyces sp. CBMA156]MBD0671373.1 hypothetical protein [Streptomyces sp. CBMA156]
MTGAAPGSGPYTVYDGPTAAQHGDHGIQNNYFTARFPDPVETAAQGLGTVVLAQWRQEAALRGLLGPEPVPVRWRAEHGGEVGDHPHLTGDPGEGSAADPVSFTDAFLRLRRRRLVVLGGPGSGKSSLAVLLVIELLQRMREAAPVPVLLSLASWRPGAEHVVGWLERQLLREYPYLGRETVDSLVRGQRVLPVLDGLDELPVAERAEALLKLNDALLTGGPLVLTCRTDDYVAAVRSASVLRSAAVVRAEPLTAGEAAGYLLRSATPQHQDRWRPLTDALREDPSCPAAEVLTVPLMLWLCRTAYERPTPDSGPGDLADRGRFPTAGAIEGHLLDSLVPSVYPSGPLPPPQPGRRASGGQPWEGRHRDPESVSRWLGFLARHLEQHGRTDLAWWELGTAMRLVQRMTVTGLVSGACVALLNGPIDGVIVFFAGPGRGLTGRLAYGLESMVADALIGALPTALVFALAHGIGFVSKGAALEPSHVRMRLGGRAGGSRARSVPEILARAGTGLAAGLAGGAGIGLLQGLARTGLLADAPRLMVGLVDAVAYGFLFALAGALMGGLMAWFEAPVAIESAQGPRDLLDTNRRTVCLQWIMSAPVLVSVIGVGGWLLMELLDGSLWGVRPTLDVLTRLRLGLLIALGGGLGMMLSLTAWGQWTVLARVWLPLTGQLPHAAMTFLEDAHQRGVLRKVGAVYQFRHVHLQHHFARLPDQRHR